MMTGFSGVKQQAVSLWAGSGRALETPRDPAAVAHEAAALDFDAIETLPAGSPEFLEIIYHLIRAAE
jgi:hypothetical protein